MMIVRLSPNRNQDLLGAGLFLLLSWSLMGAAEFPLPVADPGLLKTAGPLLARLDEAVQEALSRNDCPGAVVLVAQNGRIAWRKAYGQRSRQPSETAMTLDTVFDLASLTKPIATATSILLLVEQGKLRLADRVAQHFPGFGRHGKDAITVEHLLLHTGGLIADNPLAEYRTGRGQALEHIQALKPLVVPGERFIYSDVGYIILGELVERLSGLPLDAFAHKTLFAPLGLTDTTFRPTGSLKERAAPTERRDNHWLIGEVHDPRAALLGGVAGHAGLFSTADDLAVFAQMLLDGGQYRGRRILAPETVQRLTKPRPVPGGQRSYGWDVRTAYSGNRGELFPSGKGFGHTGFTGTSLWIDPGSGTTVILLSHRLHPDGKGNVQRLRSQVATLAAAAFLRPRVENRPRTEVRTGIDVLVQENFARLQGRRVGLVTNHTGRARDGRSTIDLFHRAPGFTLVALFNPEHGLRGSVDEKVADGKDEKTGLPVYSLYGQRRKPTAETLQGIDTLVYDIQDAGCRFYTYISTLGLVMEAAMEHKKSVVVLDRPNPIGGLAVEGPILDPGRESFTAYHSIPVRHGLTVGELAGLFKAERSLNCALEVVRLEGWRRGDLYDRTGLEWVSPSPNLRSLTEALLYPGIGLLETTNVSVGRGTDRPFEWLGAPWIDGRQLAAALAEEALPGVRFVPLRLTPTSSTHRGKVCGGVQIFVDDWAGFRSLPTGLALACALRRLYPEAWNINRFDALLCHKVTWQKVQAGKEWREVVTGWEQDVKRFQERRRPHLLYPE